MMSETYYESAFCVLAPVLKIRVNKIIKFKKLNFVEK